MSLDEIAQRYTVRFADIKPDWNVFDDSKIAGYRRAQYRYIGQTLGKPEIKYIPAGGTRMSIMYAASFTAFKMMASSLSFYR